LPDAPVITSLSLLAIDFYLQPAVTTRDHAKVRDPRTVSKAALGGDLRSLSSETDAPGSSRFESRLNERSNLQSAEDVADRVQLNPPFSDD
jgi:hypothetical protein